MADEDEDRTLGAKQAGEIYEQMRHLLKGKDRVVQATAITEIAAVWIWGHEPSLRPFMLAALTSGIEGVMAKLEAEMPWPGGGQKPN
jgi:hypothetical protein